MKVLLMFAGLAMVIGGLVLVGLSFCGITSVSPSAGTT